MFRCPFCGTKVHWHCDYDAIDVGYDFEGIVNSCSCTECKINIDAVTASETDDILFVVLGSTEEEKE